MPGLPQPQGSSRAFVRGGRAIVTSDNPKLRDWRHRLAIAIGAARGRPQLVTGPVRVELRFHLPRPKSAPKRVTWPTTRPDLDKLVRGCFDAMSDAGVWRDDSQCVELQATKCFAEGAPGVEIVAWAQEG